MELLVPMSTFNDNVTLLINPSDGAVGYHPPTEVLVWMSLPTI